MKTTISFCILILLILFSCSSPGSKNVDKFLDEYEQVVEKWETAIADGDFTTEDSDEMNKTIKDMEESAQELKKVTNWSQEQQLRYGELSERIMSAVFQSIQMQGGFQF
jgi:hypothetical protein